MEYVADALLRANTKDRYEAHGSALDRGWKNIDEVRATENMNPLPDGKGKEYRVAMNTEPVGAKPEEQKKPKRRNTIEFEKDDATFMETLRRDITAAHQVALDDVAARMDAIEDKARTRADKAGKDMTAWAAAFEEAHAVRTRGALIPCVEALAGALRATFPKRIMNHAWDEAVATYTKQSVDLDQHRGEVMGIGLLWALEEQFG